MQIITLRTALRQIARFHKRRYCKDTFDFLSKPIPISTRRPELPPNRKISRNLFLHLERISLVNFGVEKGTEILEDAISYADQLEEVNTDGVEPLFTVLENESVYLREDTVKRDVKTNDLLSHAEKVCEGYYVAPVGNITYDSPDMENNSSVTNLDEKLEKSSKI